MGKGRVREYKDVYLNKKDVRKLRKGYTVIKQAGKEHIAIHYNEDTSRAREIEKLKKKIEELKKGRK